MAALLADFLASLAARRWEWGRSDCLMVCADWFALRRGVDPAAPWRGTYASERECLAILREQGGIRRLLSRVMAKHDVERAASPDAGDIGLVTVPTLRSRTLVGAICAAAAPDRWAVLTPDKGLVIAPLRVVAAWGL